VQDTHWQSLPPTVQHEAIRSFVNWLGCAYGGAGSATVTRARAAIQHLECRGLCAVLGTQQRVEPSSAAWLNAISVSAHAFDDAHLDTVAHPAAPTIAALLAYAERHRVGGCEFLGALAVSNELQCRLSCALAVAPAQCDVGWYMTGVTGAVGVAAGVAKLMGLGEQQLCWAMGLAAMHAGGLRVSHGSMASAMIPGQAARAGLLAAHLAAAGFTCKEDALGAKHGLLHMFGRPANAAALTDRLAQHWECLRVSLKPFPSGCLTHAVIDACLQLVLRHGFASSDIVRVDLHVHKLALELTGCKTPQNSFDAQISIYHWAAAALHHRQAGLAQAAQACVQDPAVIALRERIVATVDHDLAPEAARAVVTLSKGQRYAVSVNACLGSAQRPMTDTELTAKFMCQTRASLNEEQTQQLCRIAWDLPRASDVGRAAPGFWGNKPHLDNRRTENIGMMCRS